ncbi:MAG: SH3 domain-containing protein [Patescibacteria group bacterium]
MHTKSIIASVVSALVVSGAFLGYLVSKKQVKLPAVVDKLISRSSGERYFGVFLDNNQAYFGTIANKTSQYVTLRNVYYLRAVPSGETQPEGSKLDLVKRGQELHGPQGETLINREKIQLIEEVGVKSPIMEAINKAKSASPAKPTSQKENPVQSVKATPVSGGAKSVKLKDQDIGSLRVRAQPNTGAQEVGKLNPGQSAKLIETKDGWYQIEYEPGKTGWISANYVTTEG